MLQLQRITICISMAFFLASVLPTMPAVENYLYAVFPEDIQGRIEASEINLKKDKKMVPTSKGIDLSIF